MSDLIRRQDAIDAANRTDYRGLTIEEVTWVTDEVVKELQKLPSVEPEPKKGHWVPVTNGRGGFECDQCHNYSPSYQNGDEYLSYYCPNCGADMRGE